MRASDGGMRSPRRAHKSNVSTLVTARKRRGNRRGASLVLAIVFVALFLPSYALAAAPFTVSVSPDSVVAGSSGNSLQFKLTANVAGRSTVSLQVPAVQSGSPWTRP